ncbi:hypothetical protein ACUY4Q_003540 [Phytobacter sp. AG2a]
MDSLAIRERVGVRAIGSFGVTPVPSPLWGEGQGEGKMQLLWSFRSPYVPCFSVATEPVNVPGWLTATTLATRAPGQENRRWRGALSVCLQAYRGRAKATSL